MQYLKRKACRRSKLTESSWRKSLNSTSKSQKMKEKNERTERMKEGMEVKSPSGAVAGSLAASSQVHHQQQPAFLWVNDIRWHPGHLPSSRPVRLKSMDVTECEAIAVTDGIRLHPSIGSRVDLS